MARRAGQEQPGDGDDGDALALRGEPTEHGPSHPAIGAKRMHQDEPRPRPGAVERKRAHGHNHTVAAARQITGAQPSRLPDGALVAGIVPLSDG